MRVGDVACHFFDQWLAIDINFASRRILQKLQTVIHTGTCSKPIAGSFIAATVFAKAVQVGIQPLHGCMGHDVPSYFIALKHQRAEDPVGHDPWVPVVHGYCSAHPLVIVAILHHRRE